VPPRKNRPLRKHISIELPGPAKKSKKAVTLAKRPLPFVRNCRSRETGKKKKAISDPKEGGPRRVADPAMTDQGAEGFRNLPVPHAPQGIERILLLGQRRMAEKRNLRVESHQTDTGPSSPTRIKRQDTVPQTKKGRGEAGSSTRAAVMAAREGGQLLSSSRRRKGKFLVCQSLTLYPRRAGSQKKISSQTGPFERPRKRIYQIDANARQPYSRPRASASNAGVQGRATAPRLRECLDGPSAQGTPCRTKPARPRLNSGSDRGRSSSSGRRGEAAGRKGRIEEAIEIKKSHVPRRQGEDVDPQQTVTSRETGMIN